MTQAGNQDLDLAFARQAEHAETQEEPETGEQVVRELLKKNPTMTGHVPLVDGKLAPVDFEGVQRMAKMVVSSGMAPQGVESAADATLVLLAGMEAGLSVGMTLKNVMVVNRRPAIWGDAALALVRRSRHCESVNEVVSGSGDQMVATCTCRRRGQSEPIVRTFSVADAKAAGLWGKSGPWKSYPARMLQMRARGFALRDAFPDALMGLAIAEEERDIFDASQMAATKGPSNDVPPPEEGV